MEDVNLPEVETAAPEAEPQPVEPVKPAKESFIVEIISAIDIPLLDNKGKSDPYIQAFLASPSDNDSERFQRIGVLVSTPIRYDCTEVVWNSFRDLGATPTPDSVLTIEIYHHYKDVHKSDCLLGKVDVPILSITDEQPVSIPFVNFKSGLQGKNPDFSVTLRRAFINTPPPLYRTFFMIRHGQSKWNRAMSRINITGLLDRDHALTTEGIKQAIELNSRWRQELIQDTNFNTLHADHSTSFVPEMFDFDRMDDDESLDLSDNGSSDDGSDSDGETHANTPHHGHGISHSPMAGSLPLSGGLNKIYNSFVLRRGSIGFGGGGGGHDANHGAQDGDGISPKVTGRGRSGSVTHPPTSVPKPTTVSPDNHSKSRDELDGSLHSTFSDAPPPPVSASNSAAAISQASSPVLVRRNTFIYDSDDPNDEDNEDKGPPSVTTQQTFDNFDNSSFPPLEPMANPFDAIEGHAATSTSLGAGGGIAAGIAALSVSPLEQLDASAAPPVPTSTSLSGPSFAVENIEVSIETTQVRKSALFDLFADVDPSAQLSGPPTSGSSQSPVPVTITITTTGAEYDNSSDSEASTPFKSGPDSISSEVDANVDAHTPPSAGLPRPPRASTLKVEGIASPRSPQHSPARTVHDTDDLFAEFSSPPVADLMMVEETLSPFPPPLHVAPPPYRSRAHSQEMDFRGKPTALSLEMTNPVAGTAECDSDHSDEEDDDLPQRREEYIKLFMRADIVYASPLTRALQTALAAMCGHSALTKNKLTLNRIIREIKRIGGLDTVGIECGAGIMRRVKTELTTSLGPLRAGELADAIDVDTTSADTPWWTAISSFDNEKDQLERIREFITFTRYCPHTMPVFVGHSLFFRSFYCKRISKVMSRKRPNLSANMKKYKLSNATLLAVTVKYHDLDSGDSEALILDADILFGGGFHGARHVQHRHSVNEGHHHHHSHGGGGDMRHDGIAASLMASEEDIDGSLQLEHDHMQKLASSIQHSINSSERSLQENLKSSKDAITKSVSLLSSLFDVRGSEYNSDR